MKLAFKYLLSVATLCSGAAQATTIWANGVSQETGWFDADKSGDTEKDNAMCYAASASNLIAWWQASLPQVPAGTPNTVDDIWSTYQNAAKNGATQGGVVSNALNWWLSGVYSPTTKDEASRWAVSNISLSPSSELENKDKGFYNEVYNLTNQQIFDFCGYRQEDNIIYSSYSASPFTVNYGDLLNAGMGISLGIKCDKDSNLAHAITLWGVEYDENNVLSKLWLTDSDDYNIKYGEVGLFSADVNVVNNKLYFSTDSVTWKDKDNPNVTLSSTMYSEEKDYYIAEVSVLNPSAFLVVPEPTTTTLSLLALTGLLTYRRRK